MDKVLLSGVKEAFRQARLAFDEDEVPVGAAIIHQNKILCSSRNAIVQKHDPTLHAEMGVIRQAASILGNERLTGTTLVTTLEPCVMCTGAIILARVEKVIFLAEDHKLPAFKSVVAMPGHNFYPEWELFQSEQFPAGELLSRFFASKRSKADSKKKSRMADTRYR